MQVMHTGTQSRNKYVSLTITVDKRRQIFFHPHTLLLSVLSGIFWPQPRVHMFARGRQSPSVGQCYALSPTPLALMSISFSNKAEIHHPPMQQSSTSFIKSKSLQSLHPDTRRSVHKIYHTWPLALAFYCYEVVPLTHDGVLITEGQRRPPPKTFGPIIHQTHHSSNQ